MNIVHKSIVSTEMINSEVHGDMERECFGLINNTVVMWAVYKISRVFSREKI